MTAAVLALLGLGLAVTLRRRARAGESHTDGALPPVDDCCAPSLLAEERHPERGDNLVG